MPPIIKVKGLCKEYRIGLLRKPYSTVRETIAEMARMPFRWLEGGRRETMSNIQALSHVTFELMPGQVLGLIGRNGAGKSTLLKILSRITEPSSGRAELFGRVGSLLEVGTGFHPELSGRENIFLNGAILGMSRHEIRRKFDEIVAFAENEKFLDTPVKYYSSGMYMRLAFSVAAHLEPEILLVDEVLAVGDAAFQKKCLGKMGSIASSGRTIIFVSHNMAAVRSLCTHALLLDEGHLLYEGPVAACIERYLSRLTRGVSNRVDVSRARRPAIADTRLRMETVQLVSRDHKPLIKPGDPIEVGLEFIVTEPLDDVVLGVAVRSIDNVGLVECRSNRDYGVIPRLEPGRYGTACRIDQNLLSPGTYVLSVGARCSRSYLDYVPDAMTFEIDHDDAVTSVWLEEVDGYLRLPSRWKLPYALD